MDTITVFEKVKQRDSGALFVITKSTNDNVVVYSHNSMGKGTFGPYWIMYSEAKRAKQASFETLTFFEQKYYGYTIQSEENTTFSVNAIPELIITYNPALSTCSVIIDDKKIILKEIHVVCSLQLFGLYPKVERLIINGHDKDGECITETIEQ
jgi:hypothetical protein